MEPFIRINSDSHDEWLEKRKNGIGGSDVASVLGVSPYKTNQQIYDEKAGLKEPENLDDKPVVKYGHDAEEPLRQLFMLDHPEYELFHDPYMILQSTEFPFMQVSLDGELTDVNTGKKGIYEGKTTIIHSSRDLDKWKDEIPIYYYSQCVHAMNVTGYSFFWLRVQISFAWNPDRKEIRDYFYRKEDVLADMEYVKQEVIKFWTENIMKGVRPGLKLPEL